MLRLKVDKIPLNVCVSYLCVAFGGLTSMGTGSIVFFSKKKTTIGVITCVAFGSTGAFVHG